MNLVKEINFYHQYHKNPINRILHIISAPIIIWSIGIWMSATYIIMPITVPYIMVYYVKLDKQLGLITDIYIAILLLFSKYYYNTTKYACINALEFQLLGWALQLIGHYYFERNRPVFINGVIHTFLMLPFFITTELAFTLGYKRTLHAKALIYNVNI